MDLKTELDALSDGYDRTEQHYKYDSSTNPATHTIFVMRAKNGTQNIRKSGYFPLMNITEDDHVVCLMQNAESAIINSQSPVNTFLGLQAMIHETLPHSYMLTYG